MPKLYESIRHKNSANTTGILYRIHWTLYIYGNFDDKDICFFLD